MEDQIRPAAEELARIKTGRATKRDIENAWNGYRGYVAKIANFYKGGLRTSDEVEDLISEGYFAFMDAAKTYDPEKSAFTTWLGFYLHRAFQDYVGSNSGRSRRDQCLLYAIRSFMSDYEREFGSRPTERRISAAIGISEEKIRELLNGESVGSLDESIAEDITLLDEISGASYMEDESIDRILQAEVSKALRDEIQRLPYHERRAILAVYVFGESDRKAAETLGRTETEIRADKERGLRKMRNARLKARIGRLIPDELGSIPYQSGVGRFYENGCSSTEKAALKLLRLGEKL